MSLNLFTKSHPTVLTLVHLFRENRHICLQNVSHVYLPKCASPIYTHFLIHSEKILTPIFNYKKDMRYKHFYPVPKVFTSLRIQRSEPRICWISLGFFSTPTHAPTILTSTWISSMYLRTTNSKKRHGFGVPFEKGTAFMNPLVGLCFI